MNWLQNIPAVLIFVGIMGVCFSLVRPDELEIAGGTRTISRRAHPRDPRVLRSRTLRWRFAAGFAFLIVLALVVPFLSFLSQFEGRAGEERVARELAAATQLAEDHLAEDLSPEELAQLAAGEPVTLSVFDGQGHGVDVTLQLDRAMGVFTSGRYHLRAVEGVEGLIEDRERWTYSREEQQAWALKGSIRELVAERYGLELDDHETEMLSIPERTPDSVERYGSIPLTLAMADGTYLNLDATLIWDGEFKLVGYPGGDGRLQELPRR